MMKKRVVVVLLSMLLLMLVGCTNNIVENASEDILDLDQLETKAIQVRRTHTIEDTQQSLHALAPVFAKLIQEDPSFKNLIGFEVGKKFDGDFDVLYDMISSKTTRDGMTVRGKLVKAMQQLKRTDSVDDLVNSIPYFNISIPVNFDQWNTYDGPIYVVPLRYDIDDLEIETVIGYDADGNTKTFSTATAPDFPVVVLGISERINMLKLKQQMAKQQIEQPATLHSDTVTTQADRVRLNHDEYLRGLQINGTWDLWPRGNPELYVLYAVGENEWEIKQPYPDVDTPGAWYDFNSVIFQYENTLQNTYWKLEAWDDDGGTVIDYEVTGGFAVEGQNYNIAGNFKITDADDYVGGTQIYFFHQPTHEAYGWSEFLTGGLGIRLSYKEYPIQ